MSSWKDVLAKQQDDLERLEAMDRDLATEQSSTTAEADKVLKRNPNFGVSVARKASGDDNMNFPTPKLDLDLGEGFENSSESSPSRTSSARGTRPSSAKSGSRNSLRRSKDDEVFAMPGSPGPPTPIPAAADTAARYAKAKLTNLQKQLADSEDLRKKLQEQNSDLQRTLRNDREEAKKTQKRLALLETDQRREARKTSGAGASGGATVEALSQEVAALHKEVQTAQRVAKSAEAANKSKDVQVRRAQEAVTRMKSQLQELQGTSANAAGDDRARADAAEARVKILERQRADLVSAFKKQMKLIDVLKRQKMHVEAARLLSFTEEEFVKTLDWSL
jgi:hypothetical protein